MKTQHFIVMGGMHGCIPSHCAVYETIEQAVDAMAAMYDLDPQEQHDFMRTEYMDLDPDEDGNEYIEIQVCSCSTPEIHQD